MKRQISLAVLVLALVALGWLAYLRSGRPRLVARVAGEVVAGPVGGGGWVGWVERAADQGRLMAVRRGRPREVAKGPFSALAIDGSKAFVATWPEGARIGIVDLPGGRHRELAPVGGEVSQMVVGGGRLYWLERREARLPKVPFAVAAGPLLAIRSVPVGSGAASLVATIPGDQRALAPRRFGAPGQVELVGASEDHLYWLRRERTVGGERTHVMRGGVGIEPTTVAIEPGAQTGLLLEDALLWTTVSREAAIPEQCRAVRRQSLGEERTATIADWLAREAAVVGAGRRAYAQQSDLLWSLGTRREHQRVLYRRSPVSASARAIGDQEYQVVRERTGWTIVKRPLTWWARVRHLLDG
jgi:hypothetical protein